ncbi:MAG: hypothetical protein IT558_05955 [Alphaproteobacteria bacterium]|nr:hypothetical protein [Alphaproteobacteria bacterium]
MDRRFLKDLFSNSVHLLKRFPPEERTEVAADLISDERREDYIYRNIAVLLARIPKEDRVNFAIQVLAQAQGYFTEPLAAPEL